MRQTPAQGRDLRIPVLREAQRGVLPAGRMLQPFLTVNRSRPSAGLRNPVAVPIGAEVNRQQAEKGASVK